MPFGRAAALMGLAGEAIAGINRVRARALYRDGVAPGPTSATRPPAPRWDGDQQKLYADKPYLLQ